MDELALWCKRKEIEALNRAKSNRDNPEFYSYWSGKAEGFANTWQHIVFNGKEPHPLEYNRENERYSEAVNEAMAYEAA